MSKAPFLLPSDPPCIVDIISTILSTVVISGINIIISGHLLGSILRLSTDGKIFFSIRVPLVIHLDVRGKQALAGFAAFTISLFVTGVFFDQLAVEIVIDNMSATQSKWIAVQSFAAALSLAVCLFIGFVRLVGSYIFLARSPPEKPKQSPEERVKQLTKED